MKLDDVEERHKVITRLVKKTFKQDGLWLKDQENLDDWIANMEIMKNLFSIDDLIRAEKIFLGTLNDIDNVYTRNTKEQKIYWDIVYERLRNFVDTLLLHSLEYAADSLKTWTFKTEIGQKFHADAKKKFDALIKKYLDLYDL